MLATFVCGTARPPYSVFATSAPQYSPDTIMITTRALPPPRFRTTSSTEGAEWAGNRRRLFDISLSIRIQPGRGSPIGTACNTEPDGAQYRLDATFDGHLAGLSQ